MLNVAKLCASAVVPLLLSVAQADAADLSCEVMHAWTSSGESAAVGVFASKYEKTGGHWIDRGIATNDAERAAAISRIVGGDPPCGAHFNTGEAYKTLVDAGVLRDISDIAKQDDWADKIPATFLDAITRNGKIYAIPINLQTDNWIWYSTDVLKKSGIEKFPQTWDELFAAADKIKAAGFIPMALGGGSWADQFVFRKVLVSSAGPDLYMKIFKDRDVAALSDPKVKQAIEIYGKLRNYVDSGSSTRKWNDATNLVITNKAGFQVMGDWAKGEFAAAGMTPGKEYGCTLLPGREVSIMSGDVFVTPKLKNANATAGQTLLAHVVFTPEAQLEFNIKKGSNPIRQDVDVSSMDICAQHAAAVLKNPANQIPNPQMLLSSDAFAAVRDVITVYWNTPTMTADEMTGKLAEVFKTIP
jgi:glucose/mannose transport system substrate-binding protein